jgi:hypothetical protein
MKNIFVSAILLAVPVAFAQSANQADSCANPTEYHPDGSNACEACPGIVNQDPSAGVFCTAGLSDRKFDGSNPVHCIQGYYADTSVTPNVCELETGCSLGITFETSPPTKDSDRVCDGTVTACDSQTEYQTAAPTLSANRVCAVVQPCEEDKYITTPHGLTTPRVCTARTVCGVSQYQTNANPLDDDEQRLCADLLECGSLEYQSVPPSETSNRECLTTDVCGAAGVSTAGVENYQTTEPTATSNRVCTPVTTCDSVTEYQTLAPNSERDRECATLDVCVGDEYISTVHSTTTPRVCTARDVCSDEQYQSNANPLGPEEPRVCTQLSQACSNYHDPPKWQEYAATSTSDVVCQPVTVCDGTTKYESQAPTDTSDRVCGNDVGGACEQSTDDDGWISGQYMSSAATPTSNRICTGISNCPADKYQSVAPTATTDRECGHTQPSACDALTEYESRAPTSLLNRECTALITCQLGVTYEPSPPADIYTAQRVCTGVVTDCDSLTQYQTAAPTLIANRLCATLTPVCDHATKYQSVAPTATTDRVCSSINVCDGISTFEPSPTISKTLGQYTAQRTCNDIDTCTTGQYQVTPPDTTTNRVCDDWTVCGAADVSTARVDNYQTTDPTGNTNRGCTNQPAACTASEYESTIGDASNERVCLAKKLSCPPGQFLIKSVDGSQTHNIDNQCDVCPESLIPHVVETIVECDHICTMLDTTADGHVPKIQTVSTQCSINNDESGDPLLNLATNPTAYTSSDAPSFTFTGFNCKIGYYKDGQTCTSCLHPESGFKAGTNVVCTDPSDVHSFICDTGYYIVHDPITNSYSCVPDTACDNNNFWSVLPVHCDLPDNTDAALCIGVHARTCHELTPCGAGEIEFSPPPENSDGLKTGDRVCTTIGQSGCAIGQYADGTGGCEQCSAGITNEADRALASECEKIGDDIFATACVQGFKISNDKCVFDTGVEEHGVNPSANCKFQKLSDVFDFEWTFIHTKATNADFDSSLKFKDFRQSQYYLGKTTSTFNLKQFGVTKDSYKYFSIADTPNSADYKNFAQANDEITTATQVFRVVCFVKPAYPDLLSNDYTNANILAAPFLGEGCTEIKYITPFSYDPADPEWTQLQSNQVVDSVTPDTAQYIKSVGVSSKCGAAQPATLHDVFAWSTLKTTYDEITNFKLEINLSDINLGGTPFGNPIDSDLTVEGIEFDGNVEVFDLLYISGDYTSEEKVGTSAIDSVVFTDVIAPNGPHNSGDVKIEGSVSHKCSVDLSVTSPHSDITSPHSGFHCFDSTGIAARVSNAYTSTHLNQGASVSDCTAALSSVCVPTVVVAPTVTDSRKCIDDETYGVECASALQVITVDALKTEIGVKSVIIDAIRLRDTHQFPKGQASGTFDANSFGATSTEFTCDDAACSSDPYIVLEESSGTYAHTCKWSSADFPQTPSGRVTTSGVRANGDDHVFTSNCAPSAATSGSISSTAIALPGKIFPQFYVYGITTFTKSPTTGGLPNTIAARRLGGKTEPKLETKSVFVVSPQKVISK